MVKQHLHEFPHAQLFFSYKYYSYYSFCALLLSLSCNFTVQANLFVKNQNFTDSQYNYSRTVFKVQNRSIGNKNGDLPGIISNPDSTVLYHVHGNNSTGKEYAPVILSESSPPKEIFPPTRFPLSYTLTPLEGQTASVRGLRVEESKKEVKYENKGVSVILADSPSILRLFGDRFTRNTVIRFVTEMGDRGTDCDDVTSTKSFSIYKTELTPHTALAKIQLPPLDMGEEVFYVCVRENNTDMPWVHQGTEQWLLLKSYEKWLPVWAHITLLVVLLLASGLFSGLNLGLIAMDKMQLKILVNTGSEKERRYAKKITPLRDNGNYLLCSLLLGNVLVNATLTILLDELTSGLIAVIVSTLGIVIFGEIVPQAFCSRHGLAVGARTLWLTKLLMAITFPLSYPISVILDKCLGEEIGNVYNRERLKELIKVTHAYNDLENEEINIIAGALELKQKFVTDVMTKVEHIFMLPIDAVLDFDTVSEIMSQGYSRIPVYEGNRGTIVSLLYTKDLAFVDPDDKMPLKTISEFYNNPCNFVFENVTLDVLFSDFKQGNKGHMAFVQRVVENTSGDPYYETIGLVTLEDVIEALIQAEINDETDVYENNTDRKQRSRTTSNMLPQMAINGRKSEGIHISPQLGLAAFQYLSTTVEQFSCQHISKTILQRLLDQSFFYQIKIKNRDDIKNDPTNTIYERGKPADYFVLILEGRIQAKMGKENLIFESGPFTFFGTQSLNQTIGVGEAPSTPVELRKMGPNNSVNLESMLYSTFVPDYTVRAVTDVTFLRISRSIYMAAKQATLLEKAYSQGDTSAQDRVGDHFEEQIDKMMNAVKNDKRSNQMEQDNLNYFRRASLFKTTKMDGSRLRGSDVLSEIVLSPTLIISELEKNEDEEALKSNIKRGSKEINTNARATNDVGAGNENRTSSNETSNSIFHSTDNNKSEKGGDDNAKL